MKNVPDNICLIIDEEYSDELDFDIVNESEGVYWSTGDNESKELNYTLTSKVNDFTQQQAVAFAEWIPESNWSMDANRLWYNRYNGDKGIETSELYQLFLTGQNTEG